MKVHKSISKKQSSIYNSQEVNKILYTFLLIHSFSFISIKVLLNNLKVKYLAYAFYFS